VHQVGLARSLRAMALDQAEPDGAFRTRGRTVRVGRSSASPGPPWEAHLALSAHGTAADGARLTLEETEGPASGWPAWRWRHSGMCMALPARVREVRGDTALVERGAGRGRWHLPVPEVRPGEWELLPLGTAVEQVPEEVARDLLALWEEAGQRPGGEAGRGTPCTRVPTWPWPPP